MRTVFFVGILLVLMACRGGSGASSPEQQSAPVVPRGQYVSLLEKSVEQIFDAASKRVEKEAEAVALNLSKDRPFMLAYFLDQTLNAPIVRNAAKSYGVLLAESYVLLADKQGVPFSYSEDDATPVDVERRSLWADPSKSQLHIAGYSALEKGAVEVVVGETFDATWARDTKELLGVDFLLRFNEEPLLSTLPSGGIISFTNDSTAVVDETSFFIHTVTLSEDVEVLLFIDSI